MLFAVLRLFAGEANLSGIENDLATITLAAIAPRAEGCHCVASSGIIQREAADSGEAGACATGLQD